MLHRSLADLDGMLQGRKLWRFISPDQKALLYNNYGVYSDVDLLLPWDELVAKYPLMVRCMRMQLRSRGRTDRPWKPLR